MRFRHINNRGFFSDYYFGTLFGRRSRGRAGLGGRETERAHERLARIHERAEGRCDEAPRCRELFIRPLLRDILGFHLGDGADRVHLLHATADEGLAGGRPLGAVYCGGWDENLDADRGRPTQQLGGVLSDRGLRYGFLAAGERMRLVRAPGEGPRGVYLEANLGALAEEGVYVAAGSARDARDDSFAAFHLLFQRAQYVPAEDGRTPIDQIEAESREHAQRVSEDLKRAVFASAETLVGALIRDAAGRGAIGDPATIGDGILRGYRDAALTALYRMLFILYAEDRDPRLQEHDLYKASYSIRGLIETLTSDPLRDLPENRSSIWTRLKALFRIYDRGLPRITPWENIPPRGGDFFNPETPDGRILEQARLSDRTVARIVMDLATTAPRRGVGRERVSFRELDIESLGAVYEGLLEHEPRIAREPTIEVRVSNRILALPAGDLGRLCEEKDLALSGPLDIVAGTSAERLHPGAAPGEDEADADDEDEEGSEDAREEGGDGGEDEGLRRGSAARLLRRLDPGAFHFVPSSARKGSGSFYTLPAIVDDIVRHAVGPLAHGKDVAEIERLRILDPACGSAHFLVGAMRFLGRELHRAYVEEHGGRPPPAFRSTTGTPWDDRCEATDPEARQAGSEARAWCKRRIAERCLFGVDLNPTAVSLARVALWIESLAGDRPLTYFAHHVRCGNSLLGTWLDRLDDPPLPDMRGRGVQRRQLDLFAPGVRRVVAEAAEIRRLIDGAPPDALAREGIDPESIAEMGFKERQRARADGMLAAARLVFDLRSASACIPEIWADWMSLYGNIGNAAALDAYVQSRPWWSAFEAVRARERFFHWELEFPEAFLDAERPGFDAVIGNPPWDKVLPARQEFYGRHDVLVRAYKGGDLDRRIAELHAATPGLADEFDAYRDRTTTIAHLLRRGGDFPLSEARSQAAHEDVAKYFLDRAVRLAAPAGRVGFLVPSVVYNGDGCLGLRRYLLRGAAVERFYGFENHQRRIFPIDSRYKFVSLVFRKGARADGFDAAFMRHDLSELSADGPKPWMVRVTPADIERLSPETYAFLEFRGPRDQEIAARMHEGRPTLGGEGPGAWGTRLFTDLAHVQIYNSARDKDVFTDPRSGRLHTPASVLGSDPGSTAETVSRMRDRGFWPVFEGKHISQWMAGTKPFRWWLSVDQAKAKYGREPRAEPTLVFRETARNTGDERTCIAAVLPAFSAAAHTLTGAILERVDSDAAATVLDSLCFDWALRLRTAGTHVSFTYILPMPVPPAAVVSRLPRIRTRLAYEARVSHISEMRDLWPDLWAANRAVAEAYGLGPDEFAHILAMFPRFQKKRPDLFAFFEERLAAWRAEVT